MNDWLRKIASADPEKSLCENYITTGTAIDGKCIRLSTIEKYCGKTEMHLFKEAMKNKKIFPPDVLTFVDMTVRFGANHAHMATCWQVSARNIVTVATVTTTCLSTTST